MFGGGLFDQSGGDVNASSLGGGGGQSAPPSGYAGGQEDYVAGGGGRAGDPAMTATAEARAGADSIGNSGGQNVADKLGQSHGLFTAIAGMFGPREVALAKRRRVFARAQAKMQLDQANRALTQYTQDSAIQEQKLQQSYSGRGLGESSIEQEGMKYFKDTEARTMDEMRQRVALAEDNQRLVRSTIKQSYAAKWLGFGDSVAALV